MSDLDDDLLLARHGVDIDSLVEREIRDIAIIKRKQSAVLLKALSVQNNCDRFKVISISFFAGVVIAAEILGLTPQPSWVVLPITVVFIVLVLLCSKVIRSLASRDDEYEFLKGLIEEKQKRLDFLRQVV